MYVLFHVNIEHLCNQKALLLRSLGTSPLSPTFNVSSVCSSSLTGTHMKFGLKKRLCHFLCSWSYKRTLWTKQRKSAFHETGLPLSVNQKLKNTKKHVKHGWSISPTTTSSSVAFNSKFVTKLPNSLTHWTSYGGKRGIKARQSQTIGLRFVSIFSDLEHIRHEHHRLASIWPKDTRWCSVPDKKVHMNWTPITSLLYALIDLKMSAVLKMDWWWVPDKKVDDQCVNWTRSYNSTPVASPSPITSIIVIPAIGAIVIFWNSKKRWREQRQPCSACKDWWQRQQWSDSWCPTVKYLSEQHDDGHGWLINFCFRCHMFPPNLQWFKL